MLLSCRNLKKSFGDRIVLDWVDLDICPGERIGLVGRNGAGKTTNGCGKTTLLKMLRGEESTDAGEIFLSQTIQVAYVNQELPQREKITLKALVKDYNREARKHVFQLLISLGLKYDHFGIAMGQLSRGERMKISLGDWL